MELKNELAGNDSPYLREAADQPVHWQIYSEPVFELAKRLDRPILLDIGAVWCHWCHVMDHESYSDPAVAEIINKKFVPIKVDRDQMPDVDSRYQVAVGALTGSGGWPLTGFLTSEGKVFFGGTYFPKGDLGNRRGLLTLLPQIAEMYLRSRNEILQNADEVFRRLNEYELQSSQTGELSDSIVQRIMDDAAARFDKGFGGFGTAPKFFNSTMLHLLMEEASRRHNNDLVEMVELTLDCIARGGVYDHLGGGFHRYSVDRYWHVPHFEKMLYDNALMLKAYLLGFQLTKKESYASIARDTADWLISTMQSPDGGFFGHQDADNGPHDDGTYWTWSADEIAAISTDEEKAIADQYFDIREMPGDTPEFPQRNVLRIAVDVEEIAKDLRANESEMAGIVRNLRKKLLERRTQRRTPFIDHTIFADKNGLAISSLVEASLALKERKYSHAAERAAVFIMETMIDDQGKVAHASSGNSVLYHGLLDDHVYFAIALLDLFDVGRNDSYLDTAEKIGKVLMDEFWDNESGGFFDTPYSENAKGLLATRRKPIEDTPTPSGNSGAAILFDRLFAITENGKYFDLADKTLRAFAGSADKMGIYAANYARALNLHFSVMKKAR